MKKVVITGSTGMIGLALVKECILNGVDVYAVVRPNSKRINVFPISDLIHIVECDLSQLHLLEELIPHDCDVFYHFGWGHTGKAKNCDIKYQTENIDFTIDAVRIAAKLGCRLFVGAGSQAEYGPLNVDSIKPSSPTNPRIPYGVCKLAAGKLAQIECDKLSIKCVWVRVFSVYGINDKKDMLMGTLIQKMKAGEHISMTAGIQQWDYLYCSDAARAFYLVGDKCNKSAVYCLGSGKKRPLKEYIEIVAEKIGYKEKIGFGEVPYTDASVMNLCADITDLTEQVGFVPKIDFDVGIDLYIQDILSFI